MKPPPFNFHFLQVCVVLCMLTLMAIGVIFGVRGGTVPPWLLVVFGGGQPPAAQTEVAPTENQFNINHLSVLNSIEFNKISLSRAESLASFRRPLLSDEERVRLAPQKLIESQKLTLTLKPAAEPRQSFLQVILATFILLALSSIGFYKDLPARLKAFPAGLKRRLVAAN